MRNVLNLQNLGDNNRIKQGDMSVIRYALIDANNSPIAIEGKKAVTRFLTKDDAIAYEYETTVAKNDNLNVIDIVINTVLKPDIYTLEVIVDDKYVFPSDSSEKIEITKSTLADVYNVLSVPTTVEKIKDELTISLSTIINRNINEGISKINIPEPKNYDADVAVIAQNTESINQLRNDFDNFKNEPHADRDVVIKNDADITAIKTTLEQVKQQSDTNKQNLDALGNTYNQAQEAMTNGFNQTIQAVTQNIEAMQADVDSAKKSIEEQNNVINNLSTKGNAQIDDEAIKSLTLSDVFKNAVADEANKIVTFKDYRSLGQIHLVTVTPQTTVGGVPFKAIVPYNDNFKMFALKLQGYNEYSIQNMNENDVSEKLSDILSNTLLNISIAYPQFSEFGGNLPENAGTKGMIEWAYKQFDYDGLPQPFAFRITRKLNGVIVATKDCDSVADLTSEDVDLYSKLEQGATLEVQYRYKDEVINDGMLVEDLSPKTE